MRASRGCGLAAFAVLTFGLCAASPAGGFPSADSRPAAAPQAPASQLGAFAEGKVVVTLRPGAGPERLQALAGVASAGRRHEKAFARLSGRLGRTILSLSVPGKSTRELLADFAADPAVERVEPNRRFELHALPDDPHFPRQWALDNQGQTLHGRTGAPDADIDAPEAWAAAPALQEVVVAVLDSGIDYTHQDLAGAMWVNPGEVPGNGVDDDGNGWVDDVHGADLVWPVDADPLDRDGHGSHVAGIIAARTGDGTGMAGIAPNARLMAVRAFSGGSGYTDDIVAGLLYILEMKTRFGVNVVAVNGSFGGWGNGDDDLLAEVIESLGEAGVVYVASAGNDGRDLDRSGGSVNIPAGYTSPAIVAVAATDSRDELASWSSRGQTSVDIAAPGAAILSAIPGGADGSIFFDDLESGPGNWEHGGTNDYWGLTGEDAWSGTQAVADSPGEPFLPGSDSFLALSRDLDLSGHLDDDVRLSFFARISLRASGTPHDALLVEASGDGGGSWARIAPEVTGQLSGWESWEAIVPAPLKTTAFRFRFRLSTVSHWGNLDGVILDDIAVGVRAGSNGYAEWSGTSMAAPHVAGAVALLAGRFPPDGVKSRIDRLLSGTDRLPGLGGSVLSGGRLNLARALDPALSLRPRLESVSPRGGLRAGTTVVLDGRHFGTQRGRVLFADAPWPSWGAGGSLRFRFHLVVPGAPGWTDSWTNAWLDDVRLAAGPLVLFADDMEQGAVDWVHGGVRDSWALSGENTHSPTLAWSDNPAIGAATGGDSWLMFDRSFDPGAGGASFLTLGFWNQLELSIDQKFLPEVSEDGLTWHPLDSLDSTNTGFLTANVWMRYGLPIPRAPLQAPIVSWADTAVTVRVPAGAGRFLQVVRGDGESSNLLAASGWVIERPPALTRVAAAAAALGGRLYLAGGEVDYSDLDPRPPDSWTAALEIFDPIAGWKSGPPMKHRRAGAAAAVSGGRLYVIGGYGTVPSGYDPNLTFNERVGYVEAYDPQLGLWRGRAPLPEPAEALAAAAIGTTVYVSGGYGNDYTVGSLGALWAYDTVANRWTKKAPLLVARAWHAMVAVDGKLWVFGGADGKGRLLGSAESYDPATNTWSVLPEMPFLRYAMAGATDGRFIYLTGGRDATGRHTFLTYDPATGEYEDRDLALEHPPVSRAGHNLVWLPGHGLYSLGGVEFYGWMWAPGMERLPAAPSRDFAVLSPAAGESVAAGSSTVIAWQARQGAHHYSLEASLDGGRRWRRLASSVRGTTWRWQVPRPVRNLPRCRVRVTAFTAAGARLGSAVSRRSFSVDVLTVPVPLFLDNAPGRPPNVIVWDTHGIRRRATTAEVSLSLDGGTSWKPLATLEGNPGLCPWDYPYADLQLGEVGRVRVRLRDALGVIAEGVSPRFTTVRLQGGAQP